MSWGPGEDEVWIQTSCPTTFLQCWVMALKKGQSTRPERELEPIKISTEDVHKL